MKTRISSILAAAGLAVTLLAPASGCKQDVTAQEQGATKVTAAETAPSKKVSKIVFIGKQNACDCTRKRVDNSFAALQKAITGRKDIAVEQLQVDVDEAGVEQYEKLRPIMVLPAIYLLDGSGKLVDMQQGEVTAEQLAKAIGG